MDAVDLGGLLGDVDLLAEGIVPGLDLPRLDPGLAARKGLDETQLDDAVGGNIKTGALNVEKKSSGLSRFSSISEAYEIMIGMMMPQIFSLAASSSDGRIRAARRASINFITRVLQAMLLRISVRKVDLKPIVRSSPA